MEESATFHGPFDPDRSPAGNAPARRWAAYPDLIACLMSGRPPSSAEIERVARRMAREIGPGSRNPVSAGRDPARAGKLRRAAHAALAGRACLCLKAKNPLAPGG